MRSELISLRHKLGMTQEEIGALVGKKRGYWCLLETGRRKGDPEMWIDLGIKLNLTLEELKKLMVVY